MKQRNKIKKKNKRFLKIFILLLVVSYVGYQVWAINAPNLKTEPALYSFLSESINTTGFFVRNEKIIEKEINNKALNYFFNDSDKINKDGKIAEIYEKEEDSLLQKRIKEIDEKITKLNNLNISGKNLNISPESLEKQLKLELKNTIISLNKYDFIKEQEQKEKIAYILNEKELLLGNDNDFSGQIQALQKEKDELNAKLKPSIDSILAPDSGYFVKNIDGLENEVNYSNIENIDLNTIETALEKIPNQEKSNEAIGKLILDSKWYVLANINEKDFKKLKEEDYVKMNIPEIRETPILTKIFKKVQDKKSSTYGIVLQCDFIDATVLNIRKVPIQITLKEYNGVVLEKKALHEDKIEYKSIDENGKSKTEQKKVTGVYLLNGKQIEFKEINIIYMDREKVVCQIENSQKLLSGETIKIYDEIIVQGRDIYNGKIIK